MSERKHSEKITIFKHGGNSSLRNRDNKENIDSNRKVNKNLFANTKEEHKKAENKRESLGILPDSYLNDNELSIQLEADSVENIFMNLYEINANGTSPQNHFNIHFDERHNIKNINQMPKDFPFNKLCSNEFIRKKLRTLLYNHNRQIIWYTFQSLNDHLNLDVEKNIILECGKSKR